MEEWFDEVKEIRRVADDLPDDLLLVLIGDMVTEEALPTCALAIEAKRAGAIRRGQELFRGVRVGHWLDRSARAAVAAQLCSRPR